MQSYNFSLIYLEYFDHLKNIITDILKLIFTILLFIFCFSSSFLYPTINTWTIMQLSLYSACLWNTYIFEYVVDVFQSFGKFLAIIATNIASACHSFWDNIKYFRNLEIILNIYNSLSVYFSLSLQYLNQLQVCFSCFSLYIDRFHSLSTCLEIVLLCVRYCV